MNTKWLSFTIRQDASLKNCFVPNIWMQKIHWTIIIILSEMLNSHRKPVSIFDIGTFEIVRRLKHAIATDHVLKNSEYFFFYTSTNLAACMHNTLNEFGFHWAFKQKLLI